MFSWFKKNKKSQVTLQPFDDRKEAVERSKENLKAVEEAKAKKKPKPFDDRKEGVERSKANKATKAKKTTPKKTK
jgi:hypothetical protein